MNNPNKSHHTHRKSSLAVVLALASLLAATPTEARSHGGGSTHRLAPRNYYFNRPASSIRDPFDMISDIFSMPIYMNSLLKQQQQQQQHNARAGPHYAVSEDPHTGVIELEMELPGVKAKDLDIELENGSLLRIKGSRSIKQSGETVVSEFDQLFELDKNVDPERIEVSLSDGILNIRAPKREKVVKKIQIHVNDERDEERLSSIEATPAETTNEPPNEVGDNELRITTEDS